MSSIRIEYYVNDNPITDVRHTFDYESIKSNCESLSGKT